jgi:hypothetical protein
VWCWSVRVSGRTAPSERMSGLSPPRTYGLIACTDVPRATVATESASLLSLANV